MVEMMTLYRPVNGAELALIEGTGWTAFPPRLPEQPIFYPVLDEGYARWISERWNVRDYGSGYVVRFAVDAEFAGRYPVRRVGSAEARELWVPSEELDEFNRHIVGKIEVIAEFRGGPANPPDRPDIPTRGEDRTGRRADGRAQ